MRLVGDAGPAATGALAVEPCGAPLALTAGTHVVRTGNGLDLGFGLDVVALVSSGFATAADPGRAPAVRDAGPDGATVVPRGEPYWFRLDQSENSGWKVTATRAGRTTDLGPAHSLDLYAAGWLVARPTSGPTEFAVSWPPQRQVDLALVVSALGVLGCLLLVGLRRRRSGSDRGPDSATPRWADHPGSATGPVPWVVGGIGVLGAAVTAGPWVAIGVAAVVGASRVGLHHRSVAVAARVAPPAALGAAVLLVLARQVRNDYSHDALWPTLFRPAHLLVIFGLVTLVLNVWADRPVDLDDGRAERPD